MKGLSFNEIFNDFVSLIFPRICFNCRKPLVHQEEILCTRCFSSLPETNFHLDNENPLFQKFIYENKVKFVSAYLFYHRRGVAQRLIHTMKYSNMPQIGKTVGVWYGYKLQKTGFSADVLIPVPIHKKKLALRGFNQSEVFAHGLSEILEIPVDTHSIARTIHTSTQTKKSRIDRWVNVDSIFVTTSKADVVNKDVVIVDDVLTTGATIGALIDCLVNAGVKSIGIITMATGK